MTDPEVLIPELTKLKLTDGRVPLSVKILHWGVVRSVLVIRVIQKNSVRANYTYVYNQLMFIYRGTSLYNVILTATESYNQVSGVPQ